MGLERSWTIYTNHTFMFALLMGLKKNHTVILKDYSTFAPSMELEMSMELEIFFKKLNKTC